MIEVTKQRSTGDRQIALNITALHSELAVAGICTISRVEKSFTYWQTCPIFAHSHSHYVVVSSRPF